MPPKYGRGGYRRSGYTRSSYKPSTGYGKKKMYSATRKKYSRQSYRLAASGNRKYTGAKPVYGLKSTVPTTVQASRQRVEVKQHSHQDTFEESTPPAVAAGYVAGTTAELARAAAVLEVNKVGQPIGALEPLYLAPVNGAARVLNAAAFNCGYERYRRNLTHLMEGYAHNHRIGRSVNVTGLQVMLTVQSVMQRQSTPTNRADAIEGGQVLQRRPTEWHVIVLQEYQVPTNDAFLSIQELLMTMYDSECCNNTAQLLIAPKNRYTADAHGKILMHKKITISEKNPVASRKYSLRFPKPLVVKFKGAGAGNIAENRLVLYVFPVVQSPESQLALTSQYGAGDFASRIMFEASWCNYNTVLYFTDP